MGGERATRSDGDEETVYEESTYLPPEAARLIRVRRSAQHEH